MYWNYVYSPFFCDNCMININMRCIEIVIMDGLLDRDVWLTLTWDVLKLVFDRWKINAFQRLTLTWDVLKYVFLTSIYTFFLD